MAEPKDKVYRSRKQMIVDNFIGGIAWALGSSVGFVIVLAVAGYFLSRIDFVPIVGEFLSDVFRDALKDSLRLPSF